MLYIQRSEEQQHGEYINFTSGQMFLWDPLYGRMLSQPPILNTFGPDLMFPCIPLLLHLFYLDGPCWTSIKMWRYICYSSYIMYIKCIYIHIYIYVSFNQKRGISI